MNLAFQIAHRMRDSKSSPVRDLLKYSNMPGLISLAGGIPAADLFDMEGLKAAMLTEHVQESRDAFQYSQTEGDDALKVAICDVLRSRGINASPSHLLTTTGSQQALDLVTRVFINPGDALSFLCLHQHGNGQRCSTEISSSHHCV